jgi:diaminohydroxyphosphoribosylaminopyrimidine deaminase/5-amino-6-(5-phosphoribosylamino)uracil reductase
VKDGCLVGRGVTQPGGRPHAERLALAEAGEFSRRATLYVTLEPCSHHGVTPPCVEAVVAAGISRVVSALTDPDPRVAGRGNARLRAAGIETIVGVGAAEARRDHLGHIQRVNLGRPMVTLKLAQTSDGFAAGDVHDRRLAITSQAANLRVQVLRSMHDAIMVGAGTALIDDPLLTLRLPGLSYKPLRVVLDSHLRLPAASRLAATARHYPTLIVATHSAAVDRAEELTALGAEIVQVDEDACGHIDLGAALCALGARGLTRIFSEGGPSIGSALMRLGLADEVILITALKPLGRAGLPALDAAALHALDDSSQYQLAETSYYEPDVLRRWERRL